MITILSQPSKFSGGAVDAARTRHARILEQREGVITAATEELQTLEAELLRAWQEYEASPAASRTAMRYDIRAREAAYREAEEALATKIQVERSTFRHGDVVGVMTRSVPMDKRAISLSAAAASNSGTPPAAESE